MLGFALARMEFKGKNIVFAIIISTLILPFEVLAIPLLYLMVKAPWVSFEGNRCNPLTLATSWHPAKNPASNQHHIYRDSRLYL
jgi:multiple sugar transport system permease protein